MNNGQVFGTYFPITILVRASDAPNNLSQIGFVHVLDNGTAQVLKQCTTTLQNCVQVTNAGPNNQYVQMVAWVNQNGGGRGIKL